MVVARVLSARKERKGDTEREGVKWRWGKCKEMS